MVEHAELCQYRRLWFLIMWLAYMDESGNTGRRLDDPDQPVHWLAAVLVPEDHVLDLSHDVDAILDSTLGPELARAELHGAELFSGNGTWQGVPPADQVNVYDQALALLATHECAVAHSSINKTKLTRGQSLATSPHLLALQFLIEKLNAFLRRQTEPAARASTHCRRRDQ